MNVLFVFLISFYKYFIFQQCHCNSCHDLMQRATSFNIVAISSLKENIVRFFSWYISKGEATISI